MAKVLRWTGYVLGVLLLILVIAAAAIWIVSSQKLHGGKGTPVRLGSPTSAQLADAPRMLTVLRCDGCHGKGLAGDLFCT